VRWYIKPPFDGIFTQQYLYQNYWNRTTIVEIIVGGWVVSFFETQCRCGLLLYQPSSVICRSVCRSVCHTTEPCKNGWTDRDTVWLRTRVGLGNHVFRIDRGPDAPSEGAIWERGKKSPL